jgi:interleukin-1 receptor-associated kinase 1
MHLFFFSSLILLVCFLTHESFAGTTEISYSALAADSVLCQRWCGGTTVPYPFGFSAGCPIVLSCDVTTFRTIVFLPSGGGDNDTSYRIVDFNSTTSTILLEIPSSCSRSIPDARRTLSGANYGVTSRTGLFLHGGCRETNSTSCAVPVAVMSSLLRAAQCRDNETALAASAVACVASNSPTRSAGVFLQWDKSDNTTCDNMLSSALYAETAEGTASLGVGVAELGWWLNGTCGGASEPCAANATCTDVRTPSGTEGHRCACVAGMDGDGFSAGDGCHPILKAKGELC